MFQMKDFTTIAREMVHRITGACSKITDWNEGSVVRSMVESVADQLSGIYAETYNGLLDAIDTANYRHYNFTRLPASAAYGAVRFSANAQPSDDIVIPAGTVVTIPDTNKDYATDTQVTLSATERSPEDGGGWWVEVKAVATVAGADHNTIANTVTEIKVPLQGVDAVTNPEPFVTGRDEETDEERRERFGQYINTLSRATKAALEYGAKTTQLLDSNGLVDEYVAEAYAHDYQEDATLVKGEAKIYIFNGKGGTSDSLTAECQKVIDGYVDAQGRTVPGWKAAGVQCTVVKATESPVNVTIQVKTNLGYQLADVEGKVLQNITDYLGSMKVGYPVVLSEIAYRAKAVAGVYDVNVTAPVANVAVDNKTVNIAGTITVQALV